ncbi:MAG: DUF262 domain-containing protein [Methanobrevibacter sp.]|nr:DUF262 domain-containing protein [Methanobrevibacter sp.]
MTNQVNTEIILVKDLLQKDNLRIPSYQRPYKWTTKNVNQLIDDIIFQNQQGVSEYRIGTVVLHRDKNGFLNIVDGQQRTLSLTLIAYSLIKNNAKTFSSIDSKVKIDSQNLTLLNRVFDFNFANDISKENLKNNYINIENRISDFNFEAINFFLTRCTFVLVTLEDISEAFQFFDSQNARGKDLDPHDLLKAFHLREMNHLSEKERNDVVSKWENIDSEILSNLFSLYLYRIRNWSKGYSARQFTKNEVDTFKGFSPEKEDNYPYTKPFSISHYYTDYYNNHFNRNIDKHYLKYPFQLDQVIINGKRFFEMVLYYETMMGEYNKKMADYKRAYDEKEDFKHLIDKELGQNKKIHDFKNKLINRFQIDNEKVSEIFSTLLSYPARERVGDKYVRAMFDCAVLYFLDKFGFDDKNFYFSKMIEKMFYWAYKLRLERFSVQIASIDNYAIGKDKFIPMFKEIREAMHPSDILNLHFENKINNTPANLDKLTEIKDIFLKKEAMNHEQ